jgi:hypothetical protein
MMKGIFAMLGFTERRAIVVATLFALAGCSGGSSTSGTFVPGSGAQQQSSFKSVPAGLPPSFVHSGVPFAPAVLSRVTNWAPSLQGYSTKNPLVFEGDQEEAAVNVYASNALQTNPAPIATIAVSPGCPYGMAMDKTGTLYVATNCGGNTVEKYPKGKTSASGSISDGISNPLGLAFDSKGTLYVSNYPGAITEYPSGKTSPSKTITQNLKDPFGLALDSKGDLFVADFGAEQVFEIKHGSSTVTPLARAARRRGRPEARRPLGHRRRRRQSERLQGGLDDAEPHDHGGILVPLRDQHLPDDGFRGRLEHQRVAERRVRVQTEQVLVVRDPDQRSRTADRLALGETLNAKERSSAKTAGAPASAVFRQRKRTRVVSLRSATAVATYVRATTSKPGLVTPNQSFSLRK